MAPEWAKAAMTDPSEIKALTFDVFGTLTDWRTSIIREGEALGSQRDIDLDWAHFADAWRAGYGPAMRRVEDGELTWQTIDSLHRMILGDLLIEFGVRGLRESDIDDLNRAWHRLLPWPDVREGLERLRHRYVIGPLSNGNVSLLVDLSRRADLRWDCILSAELAGHFKPHPEVYTTAAALLGLAPAQVMMVAAHNADLAAAAEVGFRTAFVYRTTEHGPHQATDLEPDPAVDLVARDLDELSDLLQVE
jgi:2-haloacid dehalogenase